MFCRKCGVKLDEGSVFCSSCGTRVSVINQNEVPVQPASDTASDTESEAVDSNAAVPEVSGEGVVAPELAGERTATQELAGGSTATPVSMEGYTDTPVIPGELYNGPVTAQKKNNGIIIGVAVAAAIVAVGGFTILRGSAAPAKVDVRSQCNFNNTAHFAFDDSRIYCVGDYFDGDEDTCVYSASYDFTDKKVILDDKDIAKIRLIDDKLYYLRIEDDQFTLGSVNTDGTNEVEMVSQPNDDDVYFTSYDVIGKGVFYLYNSELHTCNLDGQDDEVIENNVNAMMAVGKDLYYSTNSEIIKYNPKKKSSKSICSASEARDLAYDNGNIYYVTEKGIYYIEADGDSSPTTVIRESNVGSYLIDGDDLYYIRKLEIDDIKTIAEYLADDDDDYYKYAIALIGVGKLNKMDKMGGLSEELDTDPIFMLSIAATTDRKYSKMSFLADNYSELIVE